MKGGTDKLNVGNGNPATVLSEMLDMTSDTFFVNRKDATSILGALVKAKAEKKAISVLAPKRDEASDDQRKMQKEAVGLHFSHAYAITDVAEPKGELKLFNPWGYSHPNDTGWMKIDDFKRFFVSVNVNG